MSRGERNLSGVFFHKLAEKALPKKIYRVVLFHVLWFGRDHVGVPDGKYTNMIDLVLIDRRWKSAVRVCKTVKGADISSDHSFVMCKLKLRLKRTTRQQHEPRRNIDALGNATKVEQRLANLPSQPAELNDRARRLNEAKQSAVREVLPTMCKPNKPWITEHTIQLAKTKREMKQRRQELEVREKDYRVVCNVVRKAARDKQGGVAARTM